MGTRDLAGIENAERLNLIAIIVSEETGSISIATKDGLGYHKNEKRQGYFGLY